MQGDNATPAIATVDATPHTDIGGLYRGKIHERGLKAASCACRSEVEICITAQPGAERVQTAQVLQEYQQTARILEGFVCVQP